MLIASAAVAALALPAAAADYRAPRTASGAPDLGGDWTNRSLTSLERPKDFKTLVATGEEVAVYETKRRGQPPEAPPDDTVGGLESEWWETDVGLARIRGQARTSWLVSPADGQLPLRAEAVAFFKARRERNKTNYDNPETRSTGERCLSTEASGPPLMNGGYNDNYQFVQTGDVLAIHAEYMHDVRVVRIGATQHLPRQVRVWMGDSIGRWDGETLVIETTNFTPAEVQAPDGDGSADMRVVEKLTRIGPNQLHYYFRVENPKVFAQGWEGEQVFDRLAQPIYEFACHEGNYSLPHILAGGREIDRNPPPPEPPKAETAAAP
ncbi:hypothetical protein [Phenylobacterium sp.]|uniref:hypothetical protein n=1 Tax=Phenylobacterium sp. TaxID=1871053 RepID=UPI002F93D988